MHSILQWLDHDQLMEIALQHGVTSRRQVYNIIYGKSKNFILLEKLVERAEKNKQLHDRARQLEPSR